MGCLALRENEPKILGYFGAIDIMQELKNSTGKYYLALILNQNLPQVLPRPSKNPLLRNIPYLESYLGSYYMFIRYIPYLRDFGRFGLPRFHHLERGLPEVVKRYRNRYRDSTS